MRNWRPNERQRPCRTAICFDRRTTAATNATQQRTASAEAQRKVEMKSQEIVGALALSQIVIDGRHRRDLGDIDSLARSITEVGLLHPVVVTPMGKLIAGARRVEACRQLGWTEIPVTVVAIDKIARGEAAENFERKDFTPSEAVAIKRVLEPEMKAAAKERQVQGGKHKGGGKLPPAAKGKTRDKVAALTGRTARTLDKAEAIIVAAEAEPVKFGELVQTMDSTGNVDAAH